jgi:hypothetical protein
MNNPLGFDLGEDKFAITKDADGNSVLDKSIIE